ncbi:hypothetical protein CDL60_00645 [Roseateles noduli]|nr:hypothetical protein CDL60_00645 [Roseateles noduli]
MHAARRSWIAMALTAALAWPGVAAACCDAAASAPAASAAKGKTSCQPPRPRVAATTVVAEKPPVVVVCGSATATAAPVAPQKPDGQEPKASDSPSGGGGLKGADLKELLSWGAMGAVAFFALGLILLALAVFRLMTGNPVELRSGGGGFGGRNLGWESSPALALLASGGVCFLLGVVLIGQVVMGASDGYHKSMQADDKKPAATEKSGSAGKG